MQITSLQNPRIKSIAKLQSSKRERQRERLSVVEGREEIVLALQAGHRPRTVLSAPTLARQPLPDFDGELLTVSGTVFHKLSYRENPDGWLAIFESPTRSVEDLQLGDAPLLIVMEAIEKPGNLGAILRTADAAGVDGVLVCDRRAEIFSPNVVRASRGTLFSVPIVELSSVGALAYLRQRGIQIVASTPSADASFTAVDLSGPLAVAVGAEDTGLSGFWLEQADCQVRIPMRGKANSLNVSVAAALIVYEAVRQRAWSTGRSVSQA